MNNRFLVDKVFCDRWFLVDRAFCDRWLLVDKAFYNNWFMVDTSVLLQTVSLYIKRYPLSFCQLIQ